MDTDHNKILRRTFLKLYVIIVVGFFTGACNPELDSINPNLARLEVYVHGSLGNPKNDALVSIHLTQTDAENNENEVVDSRYTDINGIVNFVNIEPGRSYWIRAKPLTFPRAIEQSEILVVGVNNHDIVTL